MNEPERPLVPVVLRGIEIPLTALVGFLVKVAIAAIPAAIIVTLIIVFTLTFVGTLFGRR